jgi:hypothetical protein
MAALALPRQRPVIAVDFDGTLVDSYSAMREWHNRENETQLPPASAWPSVWLQDVWGGSADEAGEKVRKFHRQFDLQSHSPVDGAVDAMSELATRYDLYVVTANSHYPDGAIPNWLTMNFPGLLKGVSFTDLFPGPGGNNKARTMQALRARLIIEDRADVAWEIEDADLLAVVVDRYVWSLGDNSERVLHVNFMYDVPRAVHALLGPTRN